MPNWSDDEGRCHFIVDGLPCYQSWTGCPMHQVKPQRKRRRTPEQDEVERLTADPLPAAAWVREVERAAFQRGVAAMREAAAQHFEERAKQQRFAGDFFMPPVHEASARRLRALPDPEDTER